LNSQRQNDNKNKAASAVFTKETLGVIIVLFSTLIFICLITRDAVFSAPGKYIGDFLMGVFGYFAFPFSLWAIFKGVMLVVDKKTPLSFKKKSLIIVSVVCIGLFSHIVSMGGGYSSYGEYISASYSRGEGAFSAGGVCAGIIAYFLQALLTVVGSAVVVGVIFALGLYFLIADIVKNNKSVGTEREFKSTFVKNETPEITEEPNIEPTLSVAPVQNVSASQVRKPAQRLFINEGNDFAFKTKREMNKETGETFKVDSTVNSLNVSSYSGSYSEKYNSDLQKKIEYIKTPAKITFEEPKPANVSSEPRVSDYIVARTEMPAKEEEPKTEDIPMIEHEETFREDAKSRADEFNARYVNVERRSLFEEKKPAAEAETVADNTGNKAQERSFGFNAEETTDRTKDERIVEPIIDETPVVSEEKREEPPATRMREGRARSILFGDESETPSRATEPKAVDNFRSRRFISEPIESSETKPAVAEEKPEKPPVPINRTYYKPPLDLLETYAPPADAPKENHEERMEIIRRVLEDFHITVEPQGYVQGPTITRYEVKMPAGVPVKKVLSYDDDLKMRLQSKAGVRIEAPIPGKDGVGIEVANKIKVTVGLKEVIEGAAGQKVKPGSLMFALGKDIVGRSITDNLAKGPHYLVAGATGSGKSVCLNVMIISMLMRYSPEELRLILIDPKRVGFRKFEHLPHLMIDEIITEPQKAVATLQWAYKEMERRYDEFAKIEGGLVSDIESYNELVASDTVAKMPRIVIVVDELADLMETCKKDMETNIKLLAQKARAAGIHLVLATQRPSVDVVTGTIKANLPSRIALKVMNYQDSATILSEGGAEKLLGNGDMLYKNSGMSEPERYQGAWISDREISNVVTYIKEKNAAYYDDELKEFLDKSLHPKQEENSAGMNGDEEDSDGLDDFFLKALWLAVTSNSVSISQLQRRFQIGYARAGGLVDKMERLGFVSGNEGSKARRVLITREEFENRFGSMPDSY